MYFYDSTSEIEWVSSSLLSGICCASSVDSFTDYNKLYFILLSHFVEWFHAFVVNSVQILARWDNIIMLQHEVMAVDEWHNNGPQDLVTVSLCIQNAINKMHLCSLSITYACPYHNLTATMGHSIHNVDFSKLFTHTTPYMLSAICPVQWKPGFIREQNTSQKCQTPSNVTICQLKSVTTTNCSQVETPVRTTSMQMSFPETVSDRFYSEILWLCKPIVAAAVRVAGLRRSWRWKSVVCGCEAGWMYCQILWNTFGDSLW